MDKDRKQVEYEVVKTILSAMNDGKINFREAQEISKYFLLHFPADVDSKTFLIDVSQKWGIFKEILQKYELQSQYSVEDTAKLEKVKQQLSQLTKISNG